MCGIWGAWSQEKDIEFQDIEIDKITELMKNRGPDDYRIGRIDRKNVLAFRRLAIIDLEHGHQPMQEDGINLVFNGEIYNFLDLREELIQKGCEFRTSSDTEVILKGYKMWGCGIFKRLIGMYGIGLWDSVKNEGYILRDRIGIKPVYWKYEGKILTFSSDPRLLLPFSQLKHEVDEIALAQYINLGYIPAPRTIFSGVSKLEPGHMLVFKQEGDPVINPYWELRFNSNNIEDADVTSEFALIFKKVIKQHLVSDVSLSSFLSGGMDSTAIVQAVSSVIEKPLDVYHLRYESDLNDESAYAKKASKTLGLNYHELNLHQDLFSNLDAVLRLIGEPFGDTAIVSSFAVSKVMSEYCKVALSGDGGDEVFAGYSLRRLMLALKISKFPRLFQSLLSFVPGIKNYTKVDIVRWYLDSRQRFTVDEVRSYINDCNKSNLAISEQYERMHHTLKGSGAKDIVSRYLYLDQRFGLSDQMLPKVDFSSMAVSLEVRVPFLDHRIVDFANSLPLESKQWSFNRGGTKRVIRNYLKLKFSKEFINRDKKGFNVPEDQNKFDELKKRFINLVDRDGFLNIKDHLNISAINTSLKNDKLDFNQLWVLYSLIKWDVEQKTIMGI